MSCRCRTIINISGVSLQLPNWADGMAVTLEAEAKSKLAPVGRHEGPGQNLNQSPDGHLVTTHLLDNNHREGLDCLTLTECESVLSITCTYSPDGMRICFPPTCPSRIYTHTINGWQKPCQRARFQAR